MKALVRVAIAALAVSAASIAEAVTITVPDDHPTINAAVAVAGPHDVIDVRPGTYNESIRIQNGQTGLVIAGLGGVPKIVPLRSDDAFRITRVDGVWLRNLEIESTRRGVRMTDSSDAILEELIIRKGSSDGIRIRGGSDNEIRGGEILHAGGSGIRADKSTNINVHDAQTSFSRSQGISIKASSGLSLVNNNGSGNNGGGIRIIKCPLATIDANYFPGNGEDGILVRLSPNLTIIGNTALGNVDWGIRVQKSPPIATVGDLEAAGNFGGGGLGNTKVD